MAYKTENRRGVSEWIKFFREHLQSWTESQLRKKYGGYEHAVEAIEKLKKRNWFAIQE